MDPDQAIDDTSSPTSGADVDTAALEEQFSEILMLIVGTDLIFDMLTENE